MAIITAEAVASSGMPEVRTPAEVAALRATAESRVGDSDSYDHICCRAVIATVDWIAGVRAHAPATGDLMTVDELVGDGATPIPGLVLERLNAQDLEQAGVGNGRAHIWPGVVAQTLRWYERLGYTEAPVL